MLKYERPTLPPISMKVTKTELDGVLVIEPDVFTDDRGSFFESFNDERFRLETGVERSWVQDNQSRSRRGVLRGLHYQNPSPQGKLVRCVTGEIWDVAVDLRASSPTFGVWFGLKLTRENYKQLWIPEGFAHGFVALSQWADVAYKTTAQYLPEGDRAVRWDDPEIAIEWPIKEPPLLSLKDQDAPLLADTFAFE